MSRSSTASTRVPTSVCECRFVSANLPPTPPRSPAETFPRVARVAALGALALAAVGCSLIPHGTAPRQVAPPAPPDPAAVQAGLLAEATLSLHRFAGSSPEEQARQFAAARATTEPSGSPSDQLRLALLLGLPGHAGTDPGLARRTLQGLLADPTPLSPTEHAVALLELRKLDRELSLAAEVNKLSEEAGRIASEALAALNERLLAETDENQRLRRALEDAQRKLAAIALIERQTSDRDEPAPPPEDP